MRDGSRFKETEEGRISGNRGLEADQGLWDLEEILILLDELVQNAKGPY